MIFELICVYSCKIVPAYTEPSHMLHFVYIQLRRFNLQNSQIIITNFQNMQHLFLHVQNATYSGLHAILCSTLFTHS